MPSVTDYLARKIYTLSGASMDVSSSVTALVAAQHTDGGFGLDPDHESNPLDTAFALEALAAVNYTSGQFVASAVGYLLNSQQANGGWLDGANSTSVPLTAQALRALYPYRHTYSGVTAALTAGQNYLLSQRNASGLWSESFETALALTALIPNTTDLTLIDSSVSGLAGSQFANGSWNDDAYTTALALSALRAYEVRRAGTTPTASAALSGYVVRAGSTEPISGAQVTVAERSGVSVLTNSDGYFLIPNLPVGSYTVTAGKSGYTTASLAVTATAGQVTLAGTLVLDLATQTSLASGRIFDAQDLTSLSGAAVTLTGGVTYTAVSGTDGTFRFGTLAPGDYAVAITKSGYDTVTGSATLVGGQTLTINQGLVKAGGFQDTTPGPITGQVVSAVTGLPIAGTVFDLGGGLTGTSGADGQFAIASVPRGNYTATLSAGGFVSQTYIVSFPAGSLGHLGTLALYPASTNTAPTTLTLSGTVVDGVSGAPIAGASVTLTDTGASATSGPDGRFRLDGITLTSFNLAASAAGYEARTMTIQVAGFGEAQVTLPLSPPGSGATTSTFTGAVSDAISNAPIANARVSVEGTTLTTLTDASGNYTLAGIDSLQFTVAVSAAGYASAASGVTLASHGNYTLNPVLSSVAATGFQVLSVSTNQATVGANETALFTAEIASLLSASKAALVLGEVLDATGTPVATLTPYAVGTTTPASLFDFAAGETRTLTLPWPTAQLSPGTYTLVVRVVEPDTINQAAPRGEVLAEGSGYGSIMGSSAIGGAMAIDPPLVQAGTTASVSFTALVQNNGNTPLVGGSYELTVTDPASGATLYSVQGDAQALEVNQHTSLAFGNWAPTASGNLNVRVRALTAGVTGEITGTLYVGDKASGTFTVDKTVVPEGTQTVRGRIDMQGVDVRTGTSTDPLFALVKEAVKKGGAYTAPNAVSWHKTGGCLGCHVQTQSLYGLASSLDKAEIDANATKFLYNSIASSQQTNGALYMSHPQYARMQTLLGLWSLGSWENKDESFRTRYKAAKYLHQNRLQSGNKTYWTTDYASNGWWTPTVSTTALAAIGIVDVLRDAKTVDLTVLRDYSLGTGIYAGVGAGPIDLEVGPDGALYVAIYGGSVRRIDPDTKQASAAASGLPSVLYGVAFAQDGTMFVSHNKGLSRVNANGAGSTVVMTSTGTLTDVELGPDGLLYVSDYSNNRIYRVSPSGGQSETFASGGLILRPYGLAFDAAGNLLVGNAGNGNILRVTPGGVISVFAEGMAASPLYLSVQGNGDVLVTNGNGVMRINPNGVAERMLLAPSSLSSYPLYGIATTADNRTFVSHHGGSLYEVNSQTLDTSLLDSFNSELPRVANYFLGNYQDNSTDNVVHAMRMVGLAKLRDLLTDTTQLAQVNTAIAAEDTLLRSRQRADGGWGRYTGQSSDPLVSAMVGMAIDYTSPSPDDQAIRKNIQYLLNTQAADGSWNNVNNGLTTRLAATSFVMAYLPKAMERLGGIDADLHVEVPANVTLSNTTIVPTVTLPGADGATEYVWKLLGVTGAGRSVEFDLTLANMQPNESRAVASKTYLEFANSFNNDKVQVALAIPAVKAAAGMTLSLATDKGNYFASEDVTIAATVANVGPVTASGQVQLAIRAPGSTTNLVELLPVSVSNLASGAFQVYPVIWNTGATLAGSYEVYGRLFDSQGRLLAEATAPFNIGAPAVRVTTTVTTDKPAYNAWDLVNINGRVQNAASNAILAPTQVEITVRAPSGTVLKTFSNSLTEMAPLSLRDVPAALKLADAATGTYTVMLVLKDAFTRTVLGTSAASFQVERREVQAITGVVVVSSTSVYKGDSNLCTETAQNASASDLTGVRLIHQLVNADAGTGTLVDESAQNVDLPAGVVSSYLRSVDTRMLPLGDYVCVLKAEISGDIRTLAYAGFRVVEPPIRLDTSLKAGGRGRLLVLLDDPSRCAAPAQDAALLNLSRAIATTPACAKDADPFGPTAAQSLSVQRAFLENLLKAAGWSYTITETADDFTRELRSGNYTTYAMLAEHEKLSEQVQKELREAVFRGEGLLVAGIHDARNGKLAKIADALGVRFIGTVEHAVSSEFNTTETELSGRIDYLSGDFSVRVKRTTAAPLATYLLGVSQSGPDEMDCRDQTEAGLSADKGAAVDTCEGHPERYLDAITRNDYGRGRAVFAGFDLLATAARAGTSSLAADTLRTLLKRVAPASLPALTGTVLPLDLTVANQGIATGASVTLPLPAGVTVLDAGSGQITGNSLNFSIDLAVGEEKMLRFWVKLPPMPGSITFDANVSAGNPPAIKASASYSITVEIRELGPIKTQIETLIAANHPDSKALVQALNDLDKAYQSFLPARGIEHVLKATDALLGLTDSAIVEIRASLGEWVRYAGVVGY